MAIGYRWGIKPWEMDLLTLGQFEARVEQIEQWERESRRG